MSVKSVITHSSTISDLVDAESEVQAMLDTLNERMAAIQLKKSRRTPVPIPFDDKEWVKEAKKSWINLPKRRPGMIRLVVRMESVEQGFLVYPRTVTFIRIKSYFAYRHCREGGPSALSLKDDQMPADLDMEEGDIIDCTPSTGAVCTGTSASTTVPSYVTNSRPSGQRVARLRLPWIVQHVTTKSTSSTTIAIWLPATYRFDVTTPAMTVIDHNVFPHIMEAIYSYADYDTLLAMRPTSKTYRDWSDARLSEHVVVHVRRPKNEQGKPIWAAGSRSVEIHAPGGRRLPFFRSWNRGNGDDLTQWRAFGRYFARTTILDLADEGLMRGRAECIKAVCPELRTLRMLNNYESEREIANMSSSGVTFPGNSKNGTFVQFCYAAKPADPMAEGRVSRALFINPIPRGVRRCVVNLIGDMRDSKLIFIANTTLPPELRELVLVFHQIAGPTPEVKDDYQIPSATLHCFHSFAQLIAQNAHKCRITMAGALGVSERVYGFELMEDEEELRDTLVEFLGHIADEQTPMDPDEIKKANAAFHDIPWPSVPQYRKKLRPGQWKNESVPRPWYSSPELSWYTK